MKKVYIDIMVNHGQKFYRTLTYEYNPIFESGYKDLCKFVYAKCPTLKYEKGVEFNRRFELVK